MTGPEDEPSADAEDVFRNAGDGEVETSADEELPASVGGEA